MNMRERALASYGDVKVTTGVTGADNVQLIQMLFDGLIESLATARGHIERGAINEKSKALSRAGRIVVGLQGALDFDKGGDIARNPLKIGFHLRRVRPRIKIGEVPFR